MNTGCFKCDKAQWDADGCTCEITGLLVGNAARGCEYRKDIELKPCPFCGGNNIIYTDKADGKANTHCVYCNDCGGGTANFSGCSSHETLKNCVIKAWNRRAENDS